MPGFAITLIIVLLAVILLLNANRQKKKKLISSLRASHRIMEERLRERTEKWRQASGILDQATRRHEQTTTLLNETKEYLNSIINSMPSVMIGVTPSGYVTHWNLSAEKATGIREKDALGFRLAEIYPLLPISQEIITNSIFLGVPQTQESLRQTIDDETRFFDVTVFPLISNDLTGAVIRVDDVTMRVRLENMMIQNEKMLSLGELAAGMAHEINNPLAAIIQSLQNIQRRLAPENRKNREIAENSGIDLNKVVQYLDEREILKFLRGIQEAGSRAAGIVQNMLEFSRAPSRREAHVDMNTVVRHACEFSRNSVEMSMPELFPRLQLNMELAEDLPDLACSSTEIQQVLVNLIKNAAHAVQNVESPCITVRTREITHYLQIQVQDNGTGMTPKVKRHIFDPFFTTKEVGQGTGLGLSISYFIITERHHGNIEVSSTPGQGTTFSISLPLR